MKKLALTLILTGLIVIHNLVAQVAINNSGTTPAATSALDIDMPGKGLLLPRMSEAIRDTISTPALGLMIFNTTSNCLNIWSGSSWKQSCFECEIDPPIAGSNSPICEGTTLSLTASSISGATYSWTGPNAFTSSQQNPTVSTNATVSMSGTYSLVATLPDGCSSPAATTTVIVNAVPSPPTEGTHTPSADQIVWKWNVVSGATGYKWNTTNDYNTATDNGPDTSYTQTGLTCASPYTLYAWAYSPCGNSTAVTLSQTSGSCPCPDATGGTIAHLNGNTIHTFLSSGTFTPPACLSSVEVLVVAGGGGGSGGFSGAGGAGGLLHVTSHAVSGSPVSVTVGNGGAGAPAGEGTTGASGENSVFGTLVAIGGGHGISYSGTGGSGGGSGGGGNYGTGTSGGAGTPGQGYDGGGYGNSGTYYPVGGGGGSSGPGDAGVSGVRSGNGGIGTQLSISGTPTYYASGGAGSMYGAGGAAGTAFPGGGGAGCHAATGNSCTGGSGIPNTGGGGGAGGGYSGVGGSGGSGIVIVSYPTTQVICLSDPVAGTPSSTTDEITWNWNTVSGATGYKWNGVNDYNTATDNSTSTTYTETGLSCGTPDTLYVWAYNNCGPSSAVMLTQSTASCPCSGGAGGAISYAGGKTIHTFASSGSFTPPSCVGTVEVLVVGGGGGGGSYYSAGGGGGGGVVYNASFAVTNTTYPVTVGQGGAGGGAQLQGSSGENSVFSTITAVGGGGGGGYNTPSGLSGGSGGGAGKPDNQAPGSAGSGTSGQGNSGGSSNANTGTAGGGGGAGSSGANASGSTSGNGGSGVTYSISGSAVTYGGGGGAGAGNGNTPGTGGSGGGGNGSSGHTVSVVTGSNGAPNTGGGGGGQGLNTTAYSGGSGIVIISYTTP